MTTSNEYKINCLVYKLNILKLNVYHNITGRKVRGKILFLFWGGF